MIYAAFAALHLFAAPTPLPVQDQQHPAEQAFYIPFEPPIDGPLRYRVEETKERRGTETRLGSILTVQFAATEGGYRARLQNQEIAGLDFMPPVVGLEQLRELFTRPYAVRLSSAGELLALEDEELYLEAAAALVDTIGTRANLPAEIMTSVRAYVQRIRELPPAERLNLMTSQVTPVFGLGDIELVPGEHLSSPVELPTPFGPVTTDADMTLERVVGDTAFVTVTSDVRPEEFRRIIQRFIEQAAPQGQRAQIERALASTTFSLRMRESYQLSLDDGVLERYDLEKIVTSEGGGNQDHSRETRTITRLE